MKNDFKSFGSSGKDIEDKMNDNVSDIKEYDAALSELEQMSKSTQQFSLSDTWGNVGHNRDEAGLTYYDLASKTVRMIGMGTAERSHELKHGFQALIGDISFDPLQLYRSGLLHDIYDETEAYERAGAYNPMFKKYDLKFLISTSTYSRLPQIKLNINSPIREVFQNDQKSLRFLINNQGIDGSRPYIGVFNPQLEFIVGYPYNK